MSGKVNPLARKWKDVAGERFGRLVAIERSRIERKDSYWLCRCDCGSEKVVRLRSLIVGHTRSCGCFRRDADKNNNLHHGGYSGGKASPEYSSWLAMRARCLNPNHTASDRYAGRGIMICDRWLNGENGRHPFDCFLEDMGPRPEGRTLDREDNDLGYEPSNCRWATPAEQALNRRPKRKIAA